jgi:hypothetical protein
VGKHSFNIHERFLRHIWSRQYLLHKQLKTADGRIVRISDVGILNSDGGPDFRDALVRIAGVSYRGDVEIHRTVVEWMQHRHNDDPRYNRVVLHVVLETGSSLMSTLVPSGRSVPLLILEPFLSESIRALWQKTILDERALRQSAIRCFGRNQTVDAERLQNWIRRLSVERLELKLRRFDERLRELAQLHLLAVHDHRDRSGGWRIQGNPDDIPPPLRELTQKNLSEREFWDQLLYEGFMECLGYNKNQEPFVRLARAVTLREIRAQQLENAHEALQAVLLGAAGLLPKMKDVHDKESREFLRRLAVEWKARKKSYCAPILHSADWQFFPTRPGNFPVLRIAAASSLIRSILCDDLFRSLIAVLKAVAPGAEMVRSVRRLLTVVPLSFWKHHYRFGHPTTKLVHPLGQERSDELITNAIIPLALLYARTFKDRLVREGALCLFESMPPAVENSITRLMERQLLSKKLSLTSVGVQQGVIQLYKFYCREERCAECEVGEMVFGGNKGGVPG